MRITKRQLRRIIRESLLVEMMRYDADQSVMLQYALPAEGDQLKRRHTFSPEGELQQWGPGPGFKTIDDEIGFLKRKMAAAEERIENAYDEPTAGRYADTSFDERLLRDYQNRLSVYEKYKNLTARTK